MLTVELRDHVAEANTYMLPMMLPGQEECVDEVGRKSVLMQC